MGTLEMAEEEVNEFVKCDRYYDEEETFVKMIFERKGWEYEEKLISPFLFGMKLEITA